MKKVILNNLYQSSLPPKNTSVLWTKLNENGDIVSIFRYIKGEWVPYLVSIDYIKPEEDKKSKKEKEANYGKKKDR